MIFRGVAEKQARAARLLIIFAYSPPSGHWRNQGWMPRRFRLRPCFAAPARAAGSGGVVVARTAAAAAGVSMHGMGERQRCHSFSLRAMARLADMAAR